MTIEINVPQLGESITEATIGKWFKKIGEYVDADETVVELETDKVTVEVPAPKGGVIEKIAAQTGDNVEIGALLAILTEGGERPTESSDAPPPVRETPQNAQPQAQAKKQNADLPPAPAAQKIARENTIDTGTLTGTGKNGRVTKADVLDHMNTLQDDHHQGVTPISESQNTPSNEEAIPMSRIRKTIAQRLKEAQNTAAILTTFNEVDLSGVMDLRNKWKAEFEKKHEAKLGFMSFFVKAAVIALREIPAVNAEIKNDTIIYKNYYNIGVAVGTENGLVVPVLKNAHTLSFADIEKKIAQLGNAARNATLKLEDLQGGTFTISNGGIYGSMLSTPILNAPQSAILGMHNIQKRPVVINDDIVVRPMMYLALSYDHRIIDGREAVTFLVRIKQCLENAERMLLDI